MPRAYEGAEGLAQIGEFKQSLDLLNKSVKKARSMGKNPSIVVKLNKVKVIGQYFPKNQKYAGEIKNTIEEIIKYNPPLAVYRDAQEIHPVSL